MRTLNFRRDTFDQDNIFRIAIPGLRGERTATAYLLNDEGMIFIMQRPACLKDSYTDADRAETYRLNSSAPLRTGDFVVVEGVQYKVKILGNFSDAGRLIPA